MIKGKQEIKQLYKQTVVPPVKVKYDSHSQAIDNHMEFEEITGRNKCNKSLKSTSKRSKNQEESFED